MLVLWLCFNTVFAQKKDLSFFTTQALVNSPLLKDYIYQQQSNKVDSQLLRAGYGIQVAGNSSGAYAPVLNGWGYDGAISNIHNFDALVTVSQQITGKKNLNNQYMALRLQALGIENQKKISEQDLLKAVTQQYITVYGDLQQLNIISDLLNLLEQEQIALKTMTQKGVYKQTDFLSFLVTLEQQRLGATQLRNQYQNDFAMLNYVCGLIDTSFVSLPAPQLPDINLPEFSKTVFHQQFEIDSLKIRNTDKQVDFNYQPRAGIYTDGGYNSSFAATPYKNFGVSAGFTLTVPIYDGRQRRMQHQRNQIAEKTRQAYSSFYETQYYQQIRQLFQQLQQADRLITAATTQAKYTEVLITAQRQQLITGDVRITDYILAIGNYLNAKNIITQNSINKLQLINQVNYWNR